jgi:O-antigen ligase
MAIVLEKNRPTLVPVKTGRAEFVDFVLPNPGDIFMLVAFCWAALCFVMVTVGEKIARQAAGMTGSTEVRDILLADQTAIAGLMLIGIAGIAGAFYVFHNYRNFTLSLLCVALVNANANWGPLHFISFVSKYAILVYLGAYALLFFKKNGWRLISLKFYRVYVLYVAWIAFIALINKGPISDLWYMTTEFTLMIGIGIAWLMHIDTREELLEFNRAIGLAAVVLTVLNLLSPLVIANPFLAGRFQAFFNRATGFSTTYSLFVIAVFWLSMYEKRPGWRQVYTGLALAAFGMILLSGTRNATVASLMGIGVLWWVFRTKILVYIALAGMVGLLVQIVIGGSDNIDTVSSRLGSLKNDRLGAWILYWGLTLESPIVGYGYDGLKGAVFGQSLAEYIGNFRKVNVPGVHNAYLGFAVRWGFVGLSIFLTIMFLSFRQAWKVIFSPDVSDEDKKVYVLPVAMLLLVALQGIFEDTMGSTGRGSAHGLVFGAAPMLMYIYGGKLLARAQTNKESLIAAKAAKIDDG